MILWTIITTALTVSALIDLQQKKFAATQQKAGIANVLFWPIDQTLGKVSPSTHLIGTSLTLLRETGSLGHNLERYAPLAFAGDETAAELAPALRSDITAWSSSFTKWLRNYQRSKTAQQLVQSRIHSNFVKEFLFMNPNDVELLVKNIDAAANELLVGQHRFIVVLQNSDELRATGGFMGSYASIELNEGVLKKLTIQDIYQPDGQFTGYVEAPAGAAEYLSAGQGLRLPDSNWNPDFPSSAQQIMQFFAFGKETQVDGVIAINLHVAEQLLTATGPIYLPDYGQTVTAENLSSLARADRSQFFPGSQQKRQFLQALFIQLKLQLAELFATQPETLAQLLLGEAHQKQIQAFALSEDLQKLFDNVQISGRMNTYRDQRYLSLIESNVGINKANRLVTRQVNLKIEPNVTEIQLEFSNQNPVTPLKDQRGDYINYQRIFVPPSFKVHDLIVNGSVLENWDENLVTTSTNEQIKQIGFLIAVPAKASGSATISLAHPTLPVNSMTIQKQSGLPPTPYRLQTPTKTIDFLLEKDVRLSLDK